MAQKHKTPRAAVEFALQDNQRPGQPTKYTAEMKCQMFKMACEKPEDHGVPITQWTLSELQERLREEKGINVSRSRLCIFLKESSHSST